MAASDELAKLSARAKEAETHVTAARDKTKGDLERNVSAARASSQAQAEKLRKTADASKGKISDDWADVQQRWNEHIATIRANIESKKAEHDVAKAQKHAEHAEKDALFAIDFAYAAIDEADSVVLDAILRGSTPTTSRRERAHAPEEVRADGKRRPERAAAPRARRSVCRCR